MKRKPWSIIILAILHILAPLGNLVINAARSHHSVAEHWNVWVHLMPRLLFLSYVVLPVLSGIFIFICKRWSYWAYLGCLALVFVSNLYGFSTDTSLVNFGLLMMVLIADLLVVAYFVVPAVRNVYLDPKLRWWEAAPRYTFANSVDIDSSEGVGSIRNISEGGLFVLTSMHLNEGQDLKVKWLFEGKVYEVAAKVVYKSARSHVDGYGVQFTHTTASHKALKLLCAQLRERGQLVPDRLPTPEDSFIHWLKNLILKREGLFPKR